MRSYEFQKIKFFNQFYIVVKLTRIYSCQENELRFLNKFLKVPYDEQWK